MKNLYGRYNDIIDIFPANDITDDMLLHFCDWLAEKVFFIEIVATTEQDAHKVFVTMNDRGLSLTSTEMLKGYLLSEIKDDTKREKLNGIWKDKVLSLKKDDDKGDETFIKAWLRAQYAEAIRETNSLPGSDPVCPFYLARTGRCKDEIRKYVTRQFGYDLTRTCDEIRPRYHHVESCQETVPEAITAFLEGEDFEDVIRTAVSLGGDCDTLTAIAGSMAEAYYGIPARLSAECRDRVPENMRKVLDRFDDARGTFSIKT